ncbi:MAG: thioredoxin domain-containing protein [Gemmatimonadetes bacterium]|nr:thioredoxin domain-containing protein [Gemmatimonadota bacterium]
MKASRSLKNSSGPRYERRNRHAPLLLALALLVALGYAGEYGTAQEARPSGEEPRAPEETGVEGGIVLPDEQEIMINRADQARIKGSSDAPIRILEISDFQCPACARFNRETLPLLDSLYIRTGKIEYVWISFANPSHDFAWPATEAAFCAGAVGKFWPMHDVLFDRQSEWSTAKDAFPRFVEYAEELAIDSASFAACIREDRMAPLQVRDFQSVNRAGITSTPFFIIADSLSVRGAAAATQFQTIIDSLLKIKEAEG